MIEPMKLSPEERAVMRMLKEEGLLKDINKEHFHGKEDVVVVCCADGRQFVRGVFNPFMSAYADIYDEDHEVSFHPLTKHGGTLVLDENSPLLKKNPMADMVLVQDIKDAAEMGYKAICLINHFPCGMARKHGIHPMRVVESLMTAKERIKRKEGLSMVTVACFLQVTDGKQRDIYYISYDKFLSWKARCGDSQILQMLSQR